MKILIATDGSAYNRSAVAQYLVAPFAADTHVRVVAAYTRSSPMMATESMGTLREYYAGLDSEAFKLASDAVDYAADIVRRKNIGSTVMTAVLDGSPKNVILREADTFGADLIVVGASGHGAIERLLLGSVCQEVAMEAKCSVEIVRIQNK